jgi:isocitrate dehydrogenase kinase/phosphatase
MVSKLLSLRFYDFNDGDRRGLTGNIRNNGIQSTVSEAARIYLHTAIERDMAEPGHLANIADWLESFGGEVDRKVVAEYREVIRELTINAIFPCDSRYATPGF